jgi:uncharacterized protein related to proFAR isomerase
MSAVMEDFVRIAVKTSRAGSTHVLTPGHIRGEESAFVAERIGVKGSLQV